MPSSSKLEGLPQLHAAPHPADFLIGAGKLREVLLTGFHLPPSSAVNIQGELLQSHPSQGSKHTSLPLKELSTKELTMPCLQQELTSPGHCLIGRYLTFHSAPRGWKDLLASLEGTGRRSGEESQRDVFRWSEAHFWPPTLCEEVDSSAITSHIEVIRQTLT